MLAAELSDMTKAHDENAKVTTLSAFEAWDTSVLGG
jgi:hypothetical protein